MPTPRPADNTPPAFVVEDPDWLRELEREERAAKYALPAPYFSWNQAFTVLNCPACYEGIYVERRPYPRHVTLFRGALVSKGLNHGRQVLRNFAQRGARPADQPLEGHGGQLLMAEILEAGSQEYDDELAGKRVDEFDEPLPPEPPEINFGSLWKAQFKNGRPKPPPRLRRRELLGKVKDHGVAMLKAAAARQLLREPWTDYRGIEALIDFKDCFPFPFVGYLDVAYQLPRLASSRRRPTLAIQDDKTTAKPPHRPEWWQACQVTCYGMPWERDGASWVGQLCQIAETGLKKHGTQGLAQVTVYRLKPTPGQMTAVENMILSAAGVVSSGYFPPHPGWMCKFDHGLPVFQETEPRAPFLTPLERVS